MFFRNLLGLFLSFVLCVSSFSVALAATPINQNADQGYPLDNGFEINEPANAIHAQLAAGFGSATLTTDRYSGRYAVEVSAGGAAESSVRFILCTAGAFQTATFGTVTLYVKPRTGANWIRFYSRANNEDVLLKSDADGDGTFDVGKELTSGVWNQITLQFIDADNSITTATDLIATVNSGSEWGLDQIKSGKTNLYHFNLNQFGNTGTAMVGGRVQFAANGAGGFNAGETLVATGMKTVDIVDDTEAEFLEGMFSNTELINNLLIGKKSICEGGTPISSQTTGMASAFDDNMNTFWNSYKKQDNLTASVYIGYAFSSPKAITGLRVKQPSDLKAAIPSGWLATRTGTSLEHSMKIPMTVGGYDSLSIEKTAPAQEWCLAAGGQTTSEAWAIAELDFLDDSPSHYASSIKSLPQLQMIKELTCDWRESVPGECTVEIRISKNNGITWSAWYPVERGRPVAAFKGFTLTSGKLQYRVHFSAASLVDQVSVHIEGDSVKNALPSGTLCGLRIDRNFYNPDGVKKENPPRLYTLKMGAGSWGLSGNGKKIWYANPADSHYLSVYDLDSGLSARISGDIAGQDRTILLDERGITGASGARVVDIRRNAPGGILSPPGSSIGRRFVRNDGQAYGFSYGSLPYQCYSLEQHSHWVNEFSFNHYPPSKWVVSDDKNRMAVMTYYSETQETDVWVLKKKATPHLPTYESERIFDAGSGQTINFFTMDGGGKRLYFKYPTGGTASTPPGKQEAYCYDIETKSLRRYSCRLTRSGMSAIKYSASAAIMTPIPIKSCRSRQRSRLPPSRSRWINPAG